jgi:predicted Zn-dependent protease
MLALSGAGIIACSAGQRAQTETTLARTLISDEQGNQIGAQVHEDLAAKGVKYVNDATVTQYVEGIASRIFALAAKDRPGVDFKVHLIADPNTVNAFATPGGHIYVYSGLLLTADNEAELAGVMAHESGHIAGRHVERAMVNAYGFQALAAAALGQNPSMAQQLAASIAGTGLLRAHSRSEETEADEYGARYISKLDYDPRAMITFFEKLEKSEAGQPRALAWLSTHPLTPDRIDHLRSYIRNNKLHGTNLGEQRHREIKQRLGS